MQATCTESMRMAGVEDMQMAAGLFNLAGSLVYDEPQAATLAEQADAHLFAEVPLGIDDEAVIEGFRLMNRWLEAFSAGAAPEFVSAAQREWLRLFVGVGQPEVPSWANFYFDADQRVFGRETLRVRETYRSFGVEIEGLNHEPDDNLGLMLKFLGYLMAREGRAANADESARMRLAQTVFLKDHVLPWISLWRYEGVKHARDDYFRGAILFVFGLIRWRASALGFAYKTEIGSFAIGKDVQR